MNMNISLDNPDIVDFSEGIMMDSWFSVDLLSDHVASGVGYGQQESAPQMPSLSNFPPQPSSAFQYNISPQQASQEGMHHLNSLTYQKQKQGNLNLYPPSHNLMSRNILHVHDAHAQHLSQMALSSAQYDSQASGNVTSSGIPSRSRSHSEAFDLDDDSLGMSSDQDDSDFGMGDDNDTTTDGCGGKRKGGTEQKAKAKNREHARNTRIRKKYYIETLKQTVNFLAEEREKLDRERRIVLSRLAEQCAVRKKVLQTFFYYRATGEMNRIKWATILDESFQMTMPITPYRSFPPAEIVNGQRHIHGIDSVIIDTASLLVLIQSIGKVHGPENKVRAQFYCGPEDTIMSAEKSMCRWIMRTENAIECGANYECYKQGMIFSTFSPQNKLISMEQSYDVMAFMQQLRRASGDNDFQIVPNTLDSAMASSNEARVVTSAEKPYFITNINPAWSANSHLTMSEVQGKTSYVLHGSDPDKSKIAELMANVEAKRAHSAIVTNYNPRGGQSKDYIRVHPLYDNAKVTHFMSVVKAEPDSISAQPQSQGQQISSNPPLAAMTNSRAASSNESAHLIPPKLSEQGYNYRQVLQQQQYQRQQYQSKQPVSAHQQAQPQPPHHYADEREREELRKYQQQHAYLHHQQQPVKPTLLQRPNDTGSAKNTTDDQNARDSRTLDAERAAALEYMSAFTAETKVPFNKSKGVHRSPQHSVSSSSTPLPPCEATSISDTDTSSK